MQYMKEKFWRWNTLLSMPNNQLLLKKVPCVTVLVHEFAWWVHVGMVALLKHDESCHACMHAS